MMATDDERIGVMTAPTLTEFLLARIAEDEAAAMTAHHESMRGYAGPGFIRSIVEWRSQARDVRGRELIERYTPARVLAECEAKRRIIEQLSDVGWVGSYAVRDFVLEQLTLPYADHPDFREEWRP
jgi:hypothetical protein